MNTQPPRPSVSPANGSLADGRGPAEEWRPIPGYEGYEASDQGRIRSWKQRGQRGPLVMKPRPNRAGYLMVRVRTNRRFSRVHKLVLLAFVGPVPEGLQTRHLDGDKTNNVLSNLRYGTAKENAEDKTRHGTHCNTTKTHCKNNHPYDEQNTWLYTGRNERACIACRDMWRRAYRAKLRALARTG